MMTTASSQGTRLRFSTDPFALGVASGDPVSDGFVIWTRLAPAQFDGTVLDDDAIDVMWEVASDDQMRNVIRSGTVQALKSLAHAVHVEVRGLPPGRPWWYRFRLKNGDASRTGAAWSATTMGTALKEMRVAFASCQHFEQGYFTAYDLMAQDRPDLVLHLGDYIYESSWGDPVRRHEGPEPLSLGDYRARHALYKTDRSLQAAHARTPWLLTWDDHEVDNDYQGLESEDWEDHDAFVKRRAAAFQAYYEHMPLRRIAVPQAAQMKLYQRSIFGNLLQVAMIDNRQYRSPAACRTKEHGGGQVVDASCKELFEDGRSMLGDEQERWLSSALNRSQATWNMIGNGEMFSRLRQKAKSGQEGFWTDDWNGFPNARQRLISNIAKGTISNPVIVTGDIHAFWVNDVKEDFSRDESRTVATELVGTSITSAGSSFDMFNALLPQNPHVKFFESRKRGYVACRITPETLVADLRVVDDVRQVSSPGSTLASFVIESGKPGAVRA
jgi:alkaline phosphatase D